MTSNETFGQILTSWLTEDAEHRVPDHLGDVLVRTVATRQRPWWSSPERWLPLDTTTRFRGRIAAPRALVWLAVLIAVLLAVVGTAIFTGALRPSTPITGLAVNGRLLVADGNVLRSYAADGTDARVVRDLPDGAVAVAVSPDGTKAAMQIPSRPARLEILEMASGDVTTVPMPAPIEPGDQIVWSPAGDRIAFPAFAGDEEYLFVAPVDGGPATQVVMDTLDTGIGFWWPSWSPTGDRLAFVGVEKAAVDSSSIYLVRPDGSELTKLASPSLGSSPGPVTWSPEPGVQRLLYAVGVSELAVYVNDLAAGTTTRVSTGFWPTWSPDGSKIAFWTDGTKVISAADALSGKGPAAAVGPVFHDTCGNHPELAGKSFCGPVAWSPDGTRLIAPDITGGSVLSLMADGSDKPIVIPLDTQTALPKGAVAWQPIRP